jgi:type IV pilus assembly protein PilM
MATGIGIDLGSRTSRVVKIVRKRGALRWAGAAAVPADTEAGTPLPEDFSARLREAHIRPRGAVVGLSGKDTIIRYSRTPPAPAWKLDMLVGYEATQGGELDAAYDYRLLNLPVQAGSSELTLMTAIAKNDALEQRLAMLTQHGVKGPDFVPGALALYEVFSRCPEADEALDQFCLVLDVGATKTEMIIVYNGGLVFARSIGFGGRDFTRALAEALEIEPERAERLKQKHGTILDPSEIDSRPSAERPMLSALGDAADEFFKAVRASLMFARAQTRLVDLTIGRAYLAGAGAELGGLDTFLESRLEARTTPVQPPDHWNAPAEPGRPNPWMIALGLALMALEPPGERLSLLPPTAARRRRFWRRDLFAYAACGAFILAAAIATWIDIRNYRVASDALEQRRTLAEAAAERDQELEEVLRSNRLKRRQIELLDAAANTGARAVAFLDRIKRRQQGPVILQKYTYEPGSINRLDAQASGTLSGRVGESTRKQPREVLSDFYGPLARGLPGDSRELQLETEPARNGDGLAFRLVIPLRNAPLATEGDND